MRSVKIGGKATTPMVCETQQKKINQLKSVGISRFEFEVLGVLHF